MHGLHRHGRLTPSLILRALLTGDIDFFEHATAELANISISSAHILIHDSGVRGLEALHRECRFPNEMLPIMRSAINVIGESQYDGGKADRPRYAERVIERILTQLDGPLDGDQVDWLIRRLVRAQKAVHANVN